jgi:hypothetical protein
MVDPTGKQWVMKSVGRGLDPDHLRSEAMADGIYAAAGLNVPRSYIVETAEGPAKVSEFLEGGQTLQQWLVGKSKAEREAMFAQAREGFAMDALMANHDVAGLSMDNMFVHQGKLYRIDNGGALKYRAQGGAKQGWAAPVKELASMRDPAVNSVTAEIYSGLSQADIDRQIQHIVANKKAILEATTDPGVRATMAARIDWMEGQLPKKQAKAVVAVPGGKPTATRALADKATADKATEARINGAPVAADGADIEDMDMLVWEETLPDGSVVTQVKFKLTDRGNTKFEQAIGVRTVPVDSPTHPRDNGFAGLLEAAAKTVSTHASDGQYNTVTMAKYEQAKAALEILAESDDAATVAMAKHYQEGVAKIEAAKTAKKALEKGDVSPYVYKAPKAGPAEEARRYEAKNKSGIAGPVNNITAGRAKRKGQTQLVDGNSVEVDMGDDVEAVWVPRTGDTGWKDGQAFEGQVTLTIPGKPSAANLEKARKALAGLGVDTTVDEAMEEALYIHKVVYLRQDHTDAAYKAIWDSKKPPIEKVKEMKAWVAAKYKIDLPDQPTPWYNPAGTTMNSYGHGNRVFTRWDIPEDKMREEMQGHVLVHTVGGSLSDSSSGAVPRVVDALLNTGGEATSTANRVRKGVDLGATGGASSTADMKSGGASYFFTRIRKEEDARNTAGIMFKADKLARADAISYKTDNYGAIGEIGSRGSTVDDYKKYAKNSSNETIFKNGLSILDDVDHVRVWDEKEARDVVAAFHRNKIIHLPDGRAVEDIVYVKGSKVPLGGGKSVPKPP